MAQKVRTLLVDDLDPQLEATETLVFGLDGASYEIDLNDEHSAQLRGTIEPYVAAARKVGGRAAGRGAGKSASGAASAGARNGEAPESEAVRAWAKEHDIAVSGRGRIKGSVLAQFLEASGATPSGERS